MSSTSRGRKDRFSLDVSQGGNVTLFEFFSVLFQRVKRLQNLLLFVTNITNQSEILFLISINLFLILISMLILPSLEIVKIQNMFINQPDI